MVKEKHSTTTTTAASSASAAPPSSAPPDAAPAAIISDAPPPPDEQHLVHHKPKIWGTRSNGHKDGGHKEHGHQKEKEHGHVEKEHGHLECAYAITVTRRWFVGFTTLLHSLVRHSGENDACGLLFLGHSSLPDSALTEGELQLVTSITGSKPIIWHEVNATRLQKWKSVPFIREGGIMAWLKLELFYLDTHQPRSVIYLDTDMLILNPLTFVHDYVRNPDEKAWTIYGSGNFFGISGWVFTAETTPAKPNFINTGFIAFRPPATASFLKRVEERISERITKKIKLFLADQDVVNTALSRGPGNEVLVRRDWHANYRPPTNESVEAWRIAHWMGVTKPWGQMGHTSAPVRYNDQALPMLDSIWRAECLQVVAKAESLNGGVVINCGQMPQRQLPQRFDDVFYYLLFAGIAVAVLLRMARNPCRDRFGRYTACASAAAVVGLYCFSIYLVAAWDQCAWIRLLLPRWLGGRSGE